MRHVVPAIALAGCGRLGFDPASGSDRVVDAGTQDACTLGVWASPVRDPFVAVNSTDTDWASEISADGLTVLFSSKRAFEGVHNGTQNLFAATRTARDQAFGAATPLTALDEEPSNDPRDPALSEDQTELYFTAEQPADGTSCLYVARRAARDAAWTSSHATGICVPQAQDLGGAWLSHDGLRLYYDVNTTGNRRPWLTTRASRAVDFADPGAIIASLPINLGWCSFTPDELTVYCEADPPLSPRIQIWTATRTSPTAPFSTPAAFAPLASDTVDDGDPSISADGTELVYATGNNGNQDLAELVRGCD